MPARNKKIAGGKAKTALTMWRGVTIAALKKLPIDLSARQTAVLMTVHLTPGPHTIKRLAADLMISKPATCRAIDVLEAAKLVRRTTDKKDKRSIFVTPTAKGEIYLHDFASIIMHASRDAA